MYLLCQIVQNLIVFKDQPGIKILRMPINMFECNILTTIIFDE